MALSPGDYYVETGTKPLTYFNFSIDNSGVLDYSTDFDAYWSGRGTSTLTMTGLTITVDASALDQWFRLRDISSSGIIFSTTGTIETVNLLPGDYLMETGTLNYVFSIDNSGALDYSTDFDAYLSGRGTSTLTMMGPTSTQPCVLTSTQSCVRIVIIDIKPGSFPNSINLGAGGTVPVAIFSTDTFDATTVDPETVTLASAPVKLKGKGTPMASFEDVDGNGLLDMVMHVSTETLVLTDTDEEAVLEGETFDGIYIRGVDTIRVVP